MARSFAQHNSEPPYEALYPDVYYEKTLRQPDLYILAGLVVILVAVIMVDLGVRNHCGATSRAVSPDLLIPKEFILEHPECTERLIQAADITNVHIVTPEQIQCCVQNATTGNNQTICSEG